MTDEPGNQQKSTEPTPPSQPDVDAKLAELDAMKADLQKQKEELDEGRAELSELQSTLGTLVSTVRQSQQAPAAEPEPLPESDDFQADPVTGSAKVAGRVLKEGLNAYHQQLSPQIQGIQQGLLEVEYERTRQEDPKNFDRLQKQLDNALRQYQTYSPGLVRNLFYQLRGREFKKLQEMDRADTPSEPVADPSPAVGSKKSKGTEYDELNAEEVHVARGLGISPETYFKRRYGRDMKTPESDNAS